jgi:hypothetical protein
MCKPSVRSPVSDHSGPYSGEREPLVIEGRVRDHCAAQLSDAPHIWTAPYFPSGPIFIVPTIGTPIGPTGI